MTEGNTNEFRAIYDDCDAEGCDGPCESPEVCNKKPLWSDNVKKLSFTIVVTIAVLLSFQKVFQTSSSESGLLELPALAAEAQAANSDKDSVSFVYLPSKNKSENETIIASLDEATASIRKEGGGLMLHKLSQDHDHFMMLANIYKLKEFPVVLVFGPSCCSKYVLRDEFTVERLVHAYGLAKGDKKDDPNASGSACKDKKCK